MLKKSLILLFVLFCGSLFSQEQIRYTTKQGLPSNHIYDIAQDQEGFMWFATNRGLVKFDGESFRTFTIKDGLPNNDTWLLETDLKGRLWYFSKSKYQGYIKNDSVYKFLTPTEKVVSPAFICKTRDSLWFMGNGNLLTLKGNKLQKSRTFDLAYKTSENIYKKYGLNTKTSSIIFNPESKQYLVLTRDKVMFLDTDFNHKNEISLSLPENFNIRTHINSSGLLYNQTVYFAMNHGILFIDCKKKTSQYYSFKNLVAEDTAKFLRCRALPNEIQISIPGHLMRFTYDFDKVPFQTFPENLPNEQSFIDKDGNIWLITQGQGVSMIPNTQLKSKYFLKGNKIQKLGEVDNSLFAGIKDDGFYEYNSNKGFSKRKDIRSFGNIYQIKKNSHKTSGYFVSGLHTTILEDEELSELIFRNIENYKSDEECTGFKDVIEFNNAIYAITSVSVLKHNKETKKNTVSIIKGGLSQFVVFNNKLFVAGSDGLFLMDDDNFVKSESGNDLLHTPVSSVLSIDSHLMVGTDGRGVYAYNEDEVIQLKQTENLSVQKIIHQDSILWLATQDGVKKISLNYKDLSHSNMTSAFYESDGLLQNNINDIYIKDSLLYAASDIGLSRLNLNSTLYKQKPSLYFKTALDTLNFRNGERENISVSFATLNYVNQEYYKYDYRLLPLQKEWIATQTKTLNFSNLSPDTYTLEVRVTDQHNNFSVKKQYLNVIPAWWQTTVARIGLVVVSIIVFLLLIKGIKIRIRRKEQSKAEQDKRIAGLELQALRSQMNPHFVHNSLNAIQYFIQRNEVEQSEDYLVKFSKLVRLFFEYSRKQNISISNEVDLLDNYLQIEKLRFEEKLNYEIFVDPKIDAEEQTVPAMIIQPIIENAVNHGLFHKKENGKVWVAFNYIDATSFNVTIKDDGIGVEKAKAIYKNSSKNYQSNSSAVLQERLELLRQSKIWNIDFEIEDLLKLENRSGTLVSLTFKHPKL